jgi:uncharacterized protein
MVRDAPVKFSKESVNSLVIQSVSATAIRVSGETYSNAIALTPERLIPDWQFRAIEDLSIDDFESLFSGNPELIVVGTGTKNLFPPRDLVFGFARRGVGLEVMDTAAAARTFNVLAGEGRRVAAVLNLEP